MMSSIVSGHPPRLIEPFPRLLGTVVLVTGACVGVGALAPALAGSVPVWELAMIGALAFGVVMWRRVGPAHPLAWMSVLYSLYFLFGSQNWLESAGSSGLRVYVAAEPTLRLAFAGLVSFAFGVAVTAGMPRRARAPGRRDAHYLDEKNGAVPRTAGVFLAMIGLVGLFMSIRSGVPILHPAIRSEVNHGVWAYLAYALVPSALLLTMTPTSARRDLVIVGVFSLLLTVMAYRSPVILVVGTLLVLRLVQGRIRQRTLIVGAGGLLGFALVVFSYRAASAVRGGYVVPGGLLREVPLLFPLYSGFAREGVTVLARLGEAIPAATPYMHGQLQLSMFHIHAGMPSPRQYVYDVIYGTPVARTTYTPTLLGGPYMDFGILGVVVELFIVGAVVGSLYRAATRRPSAWRALWYSYATVVLAMGIHTGLLDDETLAIAPLMILISVAVARLVRREQPEHALDGTEKRLQEPVRPHIAQGLSAR